MKPLRTFALAAAVATATVALPHTAHADPPETANHGAVQHVEIGVRGHEPTGVPAGLRASGGPGRGTNGISYHGGALLNNTNGPTAYIIWYGNWSGDSATTLLPALITGLSGSPYFNINTTYYDGAARAVPNHITLGTSTTDAYSQGKTNLSDTAIQTIVANAISSGRLPKDTNGVYFVLTSIDVTKSGFLSTYCGWHTHATIAGSDIKYSFVGNPGANTACAMQSVSPNNNPGADAMASVLAHELEESATDPDLNAWYDQRGYENADKCAWTFGATYTVSNGSTANMNVGGLNFLIQRNWVNASGGYCSLSYP